MEDYTSDYVTTLLNALMKVESNFYADDIEYEDEDEEDCEEDRWDDPDWAIDNIDYANGWG